MAFLEDALRCLGKSRRGDRSEPEGNDDQSRRDNPDDDELEYIEALGAQWDAEKCSCGHRRDMHPNVNMRDPNRNCCTVLDCQCRWFEHHAASATEPMFTIEQIAKALQAMSLIVGTTTEGELRIYKQPKLAMRQRR